MLGLSKLCRWVSRERLGGKTLFVSRMLALRRPDTQPRTSLPMGYMKTTLNPSCRFTTIPSRSLTPSCRISPCVTACEWNSCWVPASLTKNSSSPNACTPTPRGRAHSAAPTLRRSETARCPYSFATASAQTASTRTGTRLPPPSLTRCCAPASSCAGARGGFAARDCMRDRGFVVNAFFSQLTRAEKHEVIHRRMSTFELHIFFFLKHTLLR
jgi:hypothetical protein